MKIRLVTNGGELVVDGGLLPFLSPPEVVIWGIRVFVQDRTYDLRDRVVYREQFAVYLLDEQVEWKNGPIQVNEDPK